MTFPNTANYYLPTPEQFETEVTTLDFKQLIHLHYELAFLLDDHLVDECDKGLDTDYMTVQFDEWVVSLKPEELINLARWIAERLAYLYRKEAHAIEQA